MTQIHSIRRILQPTSSPTFKIILVGFLVLFMLAPLNMVKETVRERSGYRDAAVESIRQGWAGSQIVAGPILVTPYTVPVEVRSFDRERNKEVVSVQQKAGSIYTFPERLAAQASLETEERYRGLYSVPVYRAGLTLEGTFDTTKIDLPQNAQAGPSYLVVTISDVRGVGAEIAASWQGKAMTPEPGTGLTNLPDGVHFILPAASSGGAAVPFHFNIPLKGTQSLAVVPVGRSTSFHAASSWAHPSFSGAFLPSAREIGADGFTADWETTFLATNMARHFTDCVTQNQCYPFEQSGFGVNLFQPVDIYQQAERAVKYAALFLVLTFGAFFAFEILKALKIHPVQYLLVGGALAVFYLLLLSLSEHMPFGLAYAAAAFAVVGLLGFYVSHVLKSRRDGALFAAMTGLVYGILYVILMSEDHALLMGSLFLFSVLAVFMVATRKVDWYAIGQRPVLTASP